MSVLYRVMVPSTKNESEVISGNEHSERVNSVLYFFSRLNGGATAINNCLGAWVDDNRKIVGENVVIVESYGDVSSLGKVKKYCGLQRVNWSQNCIGLQVLPCDMFFI